MKCERMQGSWDAGMLHEGWMLALLGLFCQKSALDFNRSKGNFPYTCYTYLDKTNNTE